ncbi:BLUF domain-containing protein [Spirosoma flavum]|uniref:BLUF domain-containing protein n=1 Tax=Spirosoma flavum TaxID=2048557 RepID=A0ABW6ASE9_9BACT
MIDHCIVYVSSSVELLREVDLSTLLLQSRQDNALAGITGVLLCLNGRIIQVLEGNQEAIEALYNRIKQDRRHTNVTTMFSHPIKQRLFASWSMGYETLTARQLEEITVVVNLDNEQETVFKAAGATILTMVKAFYESNRTH